MTSQCLSQEHQPIDLPKAKVKRPPEWKDWTNKDRMMWLRDQRRQHKGGRPRRLIESDVNRVNILMTELNNKSLVAESLGISRSTLYRFLNRFPSEEMATEILEDIGQAPYVVDYPEIRTWYNRQLLHSKKSTARQYLVHIRAFYKYMLLHHPSRARPSLWTSDDIVEYLNNHEPYQRKNILDGLRSLAKKAQEKFPRINLALLPTQKANKAKRSHAGREEYYCSRRQIRALIQNVPATTRFQAARSKAMLATLYNTAIRAGNPSEDRGLLGMRVENLHLDQHIVEVKDKGGQWWLVCGLTDNTIHLIKDYLKERNQIADPEEGYLWISERGYPLRQRQLNAMIKEAGREAEIKGKKLTSKMFRKTFVKHALESGIRPISLIGTGKTVKTCFCVGWTGQKAIDTIMTFYAPQLLAQIEKDREKFKWGNDTAGGTAG
jgi:integrase